MDVVAGDSGVETEFDLESNDSSMSGLSGGAGGAGVPVQLQPLPEVSIIMVMMDNKMGMLIMLQYIVALHYGEVAMGIWK